MKWYHGLESIVEENTPLAQRTWYRLGGAARYFCTPQDARQVCQVVRRCTEHGLALKVLGVGANVLVRDEGYDGVVMHLHGDAFGRIDFNGYRLTAGAAAELPEVIRRAVLRGLAGLEGLAGIPGSIGGTVRMNAGGKFGEIADAVDSVVIVDEHGELVSWQREVLRFGYRRSNIADNIVLSASFDLRATEADALLKRYREIWDFKKNSQPFTRNNAGCMFKNPQGHHAGELIDRAGFKGQSFGGATVSPRHANFIEAGADAKSADVLALAERVRSGVRDQFDVELEYEIDVW